MNGLSHDPRKRKQAARLPPASGPWTSNATHWSHCQSVPPAVLSLPLPRHVLHFFAHSAAVTFSWSSHGQDGRHAGWELCQYPGA